MNLSSIQIPKIKIPIRVVAILLAIIGAVFLYWTNEKKVPEIEAQTAKLVSENKSLAKTEENLTVLYNNMPFYLEEIDRLNKETEDILTEFPAFMHLEDKILYASTLLSTDLKEFNLSSFSYGASNYVMSVAYGPEGAKNKTLDLYSVNLNGRYSDLTYRQVKDLLDYGLTSDQRFVVKSISMGYNEKTGYLSGDFVFTTYFVPGQRTPYEFPQSVVHNYVGSGNRVDDLFGARLTPQSNAEPEN